MPVRILFFLSLLLVGTPSVFSENWPQWRGPFGSGVSPEDQLPVNFGPEENVVWKAALKGPGVSSPVIWGNQVFLTSQEGRGVLRPGNHPSLSRGQDATERGLGSEDQDTASESDVFFVVQAFDTDDGSLNWEYRFRAEGPLPEVHRKNNLATPSCVTEGEGVYCWFGNGQIVALDMNGQLSWKAHLGEIYSPYEISWGHSSSPVLYRDLLILLSDHEPSSYLLALEKKSGKERWKVDRNSGLRSYSTPLLILGENQRDELIVNSSKGIDSYSPSNGALLWSFEEANRFPVPSPSFGDGTIFASRGHRSGPYMAIEPGGQGAISKDSLKWHVPTGAPYVSSLVYYRGLLFMVTEGGIVTCVDGKTGDTLWRSRVQGVFSASPVAGDGKVYLANEGGEIFVLRAAREVDLLARNQMGERFLASPAIAGGRIYLRSDQHLFAIANNPGPGH